MKQLTKALLSPKRELGIQYDVTIEVTTDEEVESFSICVLVDHFGELNGKIEALMKQADSIGYDAWEVRSATINRRVEKV